MIDRLMQAVVLIWSLSALSSTAMAQTIPEMTTAQKIKLSAVGQPDGALPPGTITVWSVDGATASEPRGQFVPVENEPLSVWYLPSVGGPHIVRVSMVVNGLTFMATQQITVTVPPLAAVAIKVGSPVSR